jgi:hypothetical protein
METETIQTKQKYTFNENTQKYIFHTQEKFGRNVVLGSKKVNTIIELYSNYDKIPHTMGDISKKLGIPKAVVESIIKAMGITHDTIPFSQERIEESDVDILVDEMLDNKSFQINQKFEKLDWKRTQEDAIKWREFTQLNVNPFNNFIENWVPPKYTPLKVPSFKNAKSDKVFVAVLSDLHFGSFANAKYMFNREGWTTQDTVKAVDKYAQQIVEEVADRKTSFNRCVVVGLGDLIHSMLGKTARGTELKYDVIREEQFDYALNSLLTFLTRMVEIFETVECHDVGGNHHYELDMALFRALDLYFKSDKRITFTHYSTRPAAFRIDNTLIMMDHGADSVERTYVPTGGKVEKHVNNILMNNVHLLDGVNTRLFIQGDKHHFEHLEFATFEYIMFGTIVGSDEHAATNNWYNRARQSCMVLDKNGLREIIHIYTQKE